MSVPAVTPCTETSPLPVLAVTLPVVAVIDSPAVTFPFVLCSVIFAPACNALTAEIPVDAVTPIEPSVPAVTVSLVVTAPLWLVNVTPLPACTVPLVVTVPFAFTVAAPVSASTAPTSVAFPAPLVTVTSVPAVTLSFSVTPLSPVTVTFLSIDSIAFSAVTLPFVASIYTASSAFAVLPSTIFPDAVSTVIEPPSVVAVRAAVSAVVIFPDPV